MPRPYFTPIAMHELAEEVSWEYANHVQKAETYLAAGNLPLFWLHSNICAAIHATLEGGSTVSIRSIGDTVKLPPTPTENPSPAVETK